MRGAITTHETSVRVPPDILQFGESYSFIVEALIEGGVSTTRPFVRALHREVAQAVTGRVSP